MNAVPRTTTRSAPAMTQAQSEEAGLLDDVASNPADDGPRLIYADWLDDRGDPARAEFLRLGVRLDRHQRADDRARHQELLDRYGSFWFGTVMEAATAWHLAGGLVDGVTVSAAAFVARAPALLRDAPAADWRVVVASGGELRAFTACPEFARLRRLTLAGCPLGGYGVRIVTACPRAAGLRSLSLNGLGVGQPGVQALAVSVHLG
ncbi:MAG: TIGR02996 domain-containing protein, partial [Gemmataceae bacterium]